MFLSRLLRGLKPAKSTKTDGDTPLELKELKPRPTSRATGDAYDNAGSHRAAPPPPSRLDGPRRAP
jgi:hypothetical protein